MTSQTTQTRSFTQLVADDIVALVSQDFTELLNERVRHCVLDWLAVAIAGSTEPVGKIAQELTANADLHGTSATLVGTKDRAGVDGAVLTNGLAAHAMDFDSSTPWARGHAVTPVVAATLALAEVEDASGADVAAAVVAGLQAACVVGLALGPGADTHGLHLTGHTGTFGAAAAGATLLRLDADGVAMALSLAATQAAGLRSVFGTMGKHLNAARAGVDGAMAARLVERGFTAPREAIDCAAGYAASLTDTFDANRPAREMGRHLGVENTVFKFHACCHGAHSAIEGVNAIRRRQGFSADEVKHVRLTIPPELVNICGITNPLTGADGQFCLPHAVALALAGESTGPEGFTDETVVAPWSRSLRERIEVVAGSADMAVTMPTEVVVEFASGVERSACVPVMDPAEDEDLALQRQRLEAKFAGLVMPVLGAARTRELKTMVNSLQDVDSVRDLMALTSPAG